METENEKYIKRMRSALLKYIESETLDLDEHILSTAEIILKDKTSTIYDLITTADILGLDAKDVNSLL